MKSETGESTCPRVRGEEVRGFCTLPIFLSFIENQDSGVQTPQVDRKLWDCKQST